MHERLQHVVKNNIVDKSKSEREIAEYKQKLLNEIENSDKLFSKGMRYLSSQMIDSIVINMDDLWSVKFHNKVI